MASLIGVVRPNYTTMQNHNKVQVLQQSSATNANNERSEKIIILRKKPTIIAKDSSPTRQQSTVINNNNNDNITSNNNINNMTATVKKNNQNNIPSPHGVSSRAKRKSSMVCRALSEESGGGGGGGGGGGVIRPQQPPPVAVARRNARERNRVKQVNNGFATLRQHIPASLATAYTAAENPGRGSSKKLSKVETLRMAVDYIRRLQQLLSVDDDDESHNALTSPVSLIPTSPSPSSSSHNPSLNQNYISFEDDTEHEASSVIMEDDDSSCVDMASPTSSTNPSSQYHRTSLIQLVNAQDDTKNYGYQYEVDENMAPHLASSGASLVPLGRMTLITSARPGDYQLHDVQHSVSDNYQHTSPVELLPPHHQTASSLSPGVYSEQSLSPAEDERKMYLPAFSTNLKSPMNSVMESVIHQTYHTMEQLAVVKKEEEDRDDDGGGGEMIEMIGWWDQEQRVRQRQQ